MDRVCVNAGDGSLSKTTLPKLAVAMVTERHAFLWDFGSEEGEGWNVP